MSRTLVAIVIAALVSGASASAADAVQPQASHDVLLAAAMMPSHPTDDLRYASIPGDAIDDAILGAFPIRPEDLEGALAPPPQKVTLDNSYAPVVFSHAGHLARRTTCRLCHGDGPVRKIGRFQPKDAHDRCRSCHVQAKRGPTECNGCHHKRPPPPPVQTAKALEKGPEAPARLFDEAAAVRAYDVAAAWPAAPAPPSADLASERMTYDVPFSAARRTVWAGGSMLAGSGTPTSAALAVGVNYRQDGFQLSQTLEWAGTGGQRRTLGLLGAGVVLPVAPQWTAHVLGVGGFDAFDAHWASFLPAVGARAGLQWTSPRHFVHSMDFSVTALADVARGRDGSGGRTGGGVLSICLSAGIDLNRAQR